MFFLRSSECCAALALLMWGLWELCWLWRNVECCAALPLPASYPSTTAVAQPQATDAVASVPPTPPAPHGVAVRAAAAEVTNVADSCGDGPTMCKRVRAAAPASASGVRCGLDRARGAQVMPCAPARPLCSPEAAGPPRRGAPPPAAEGGRPCAQASPLASAPARSPPAVAPVLLLPPCARPPGAPKCTVCSMCV